MTWAIVCGGRDYADRARVHQILNAAVDRLGLVGIIEGEAGKESEQMDPETGEFRMRVTKGADKFAREWATDRGDVSCIAVPADWSKGRGAGYARNSIMLVMLQRHDGPKAVIAFPGGVGTANMVKITHFANRGHGGAGIRIIEVDRKPRVMNRHADAHLLSDETCVYVGRGSPYGNPFVIGEHGDRDEVCDRFEREILPTLDVRALRGKDLVCYCAPQRCHADSILKKANANE